MQYRSSTLILVAALFINCFTLAAAALAAIDSTYKFKIDSQNLSSALLQFSEQAQMQVLSSSDDVKEKTSPGVSGEHTAREALRILLQGTGLGFRVVTDDTVAIEPDKEKEKNELAATGQTPLQSEPSQQNAATPKDTATHQETANVSAGFGVISGKVTAANGTPATDAEVTLLELHRKVRVNESAEFRIDNVPSGQYLLQIESKRAGQAVQTILVKRGEELKLEISLQILIHKEEVVVSANPEVRTINEVYQPVSVLSGTDLTTRMRPTLGETLSDEPGVNSTYFGPGSSRPVIRGLGGDRIRILIDGIGSGDASETSPDHAISFDPVSAERIEVVRGPATLLYGSSAIGGVVNIFDNRIPNYLPEKPITGTVLADFGSVADEKLGSASLDGSAGNFGWHVDLMKRDTGDYKIPGFAESERLREEEGGGAQQEGGAAQQVAGDGVGDHQTEMGAFGVLPNSSIEADGLAGGLSYIREKGFFGISYSGYNSNYGIPGHGSGEAGNEENVRIDLKQRRFDARSEISEPLAGLRGLKFRLGVTDYDLTEVEGTEVKNKDWETRLEALHKPIGIFNGSFGLQISHRNFEAIGAEASVPPTQTNNWAGFLFEEVGKGKVRFEVGTRYERQHITAESSEMNNKLPEARLIPTFIAAEANDELPAGASNRTLDGLSASAGLLWLPNDDYSASLSIARSVKLPNLEELFSNGPHPATGAFEIGDPNLGKEVSIGFDAALRKRTGRLTGEISFFVNRFNHFILQQATGEEEDGLPVFLFVQQNANFLGAEFRADLEVFNSEPHHIFVEFVGDSVRAENRDTKQPLPRIPPMRLGAGIRYQGGKFWSSAELRYTDKQDRVAEFESPTSSFTFLNASFGYRFFAGNTIHDIILRGTNLTNREGRDHVSFLKELAPLPGRDISLIYRLFF